MKGWVSLAIAFLVGVALANRVGFLSAIAGK